MKIISQKHSKLNVLLLLFTLLVFNQNTMCQSKIYFDKDWNVTTVENAHFYRLITKKNDSLHQIKDYYKNNVLQMEGYVSDLEKETLEGEVVWYTEEGKILNKATYKNGILHGISSIYNENGDLNYTIEYMDGQIYNGVYITSFYKQFYKKGKLIKQVEYNAPNAFRSLQTRVFGNETDSVYWQNNKGDSLIGIGIYSSKSTVPIEGLNITNNFLIAVHTQYKNHKREGIQKVYYEGKLLSEQIFVNDTITFEKSVNPLTKKTVHIDFKKGLPYNGHLFQFDQVYEYYNEFIYKEGEVIIKNHYELINDTLTLNPEKSYVK